MNHIPQHNVNQRLTKKKPYVKKYGVFSGFTAWIVDGAYIRENIDEEFTNFGQHYEFRFIPKREFWIDKEYAPGEEKYFIDHLLVEYRLMEQGIPYRIAHKRAVRIGRKERMKSRRAKTLAGLNKKNVIAKIHKRLLKMYSKGAAIWIVNSELVRDIYDMDFTEGGHDKVYSFIPKGEVWIDDDIGPRERAFVLLHELHERYLMSKGWTYDSAHRSASAIEYQCRKHPALLKKCLAAEVKKNALLITVHATRF